MATPVPAPSVPTSLAGLAASTIDPVVDLRVSIQGDVEGPGRTPELTLYRDGTVIRRVDGGARVTKLTPAGKEMLQRAAAESGLFDESGSIPIDPAYEGGFMSYVMDLRTNDGLVRRTTPNAVARKHAGEARLLIALAERLSTPEQLVPLDAWLVPPSEGVPYVAASYRLETMVQPSGADPNDPNLPGDIATLRWPLERSLVEWGRPYDRDGWDADTIYRCGLLSLSEAIDVESALAGWWSPERLPAADFMSAQLSWRAQRSVVDVLMTNVLPEEEARDCRG